MSKEKEIGEMITALHEGLLPLKETYGTDEIARCLYENGYRKQEDVANEIFAEIETSLHYKFIDGEIHLIIRESDYNHYKKKYTEDKS